MTCGADVTGGHWDPWNACGGASGNPYCGDDQNNSKCIPKGGDSYAPDFPAMPFSVEVGDWSSKYGKLEMDDSYMIDRVDSSFYEVTPADMEGFSVVFHCNDGSRAFCALFEESSDVMATATVPAQGSSTSAMAIFSELVAGILPSEITISATGEVSGFLAAQDVFDSATDCASFEYGIFEAGSMTLEESAQGAGCDGYVGDFYDPTHQCPSFSGSEYCTAGKLCEDEDYMYDCDFELDAYSCAPGDLSGKFGSLVNPGEDTLTIFNMTDRTLVPLTSSLQGKVMAIYCAESEQPELTVFACAPFTTTTPSPTEAGNSGASSVTFGFGAIMTALAVMW